MTSIAAVIVTYNNSGMLEQLLGALKAQSRLPEISIVVDNASVDETPAVAARFPEMIYVRLPRNTGSAGGYAEGMRLALEHGSDLIWTLDDDVQLDPGSLAGLVKTLAGFPEIERVCAVRSVGACCSLTSPSPLSVVSWRGTLFSAEAVKRAGLPERKLFLYGDDLEYSLRLTRLGYKFYWAPASRCIENRMDGKTELRFLGLHARVYFEPLRLYYAFRNEIYTYLLYHKAAAVLRVFGYACKLSAAFLLLRPLGAVERIVAIISGIRDGMCGRLGEHRSRKVNGQI